MISFIVPAHNEQACLGRTLQAIHDSARVVGQPYEIIVVDDASTDATAEIARQHNATLVPVNHRQIAATRNSGGRAANGERLFFIDADTIINPRAVAEALRYMDKGFSGRLVPGCPPGARMTFAPAMIQILFKLRLLVPKIVGFTGRSLQCFVRKRHFPLPERSATGKRIYWGEVKSHKRPCVETAGPVRRGAADNRVHASRFRKTSLHDDFCV